MQITQSPLMNFDLPSTLSIVYMWQFDPDHDGAGNWPAWDDAPAFSSSSWSRTLSIEGILDRSVNSLRGVSSLEPYGLFPASFRLELILRSGFAWTSAELDRFPWPPAAVASARANGTGDGFLKTETSRTYRAFTFEESQNPQADQMILSFPSANYPAHPDGAYWWGYDNRTEVTDSTEPSSMAVGVFGGRYRDAASGSHAYDLDVVALGAGGFPSNSGDCAVDITLQTRRLIALAPHYDFFLEFFHPPAVDVDLDGLDQAAGWDKLLKAVTGWDGGGWQKITLTDPEEPAGGMWLPHGGPVTDLYWEWGTSVTATSDWQAGEDLSGTSLAATDRLHYGVPPVQTPIPAN
jgi:hypothetical protein